MAEKLISRVFALSDLDIKRVDRKGREVTAYAAVFAEPAEIHDKYGHYWEEINRTGFNRTISHPGFLNRVSVFYNHGYDLTGKPNMLGAVPIATAREVKADSRGLITRSYYNDSDLASAILAGWEGGQIKGQSFSGRVYQDRLLGQLDGLDHVERTELGLREYGPTYSPAYEGAGLVAIRSDVELAELVRSIITEINGTSTKASPLTGNTAPTPPGPGDEDEDSGRAHSSRNARIARARAARMKLEIGHA